MARCRATRRCLPVGSAIELIVEVPAVKKNDRRTLGGAGRGGRADARRLRRDGNRSAAVRPSGRGHGHRRIARPALLAGQGRDGRSYRAAHRRLVVWRRRAWRRSRCEFAGNHGQPFARILPACAMLMLILLVTHALAAGLEGRLRGGSGDAESAREMAGRTAAIVLALLGSVPLWLGPAAELLARRQPWIIDAVIGVSPLTHLAVASGNDLLRNPWFYQHVESRRTAILVSQPGRYHPVLRHGRLDAGPHPAGIPEAAPSSRERRPDFPTMEQAK